MRHEISLTYFLRLLHLWMKRGRGHLNPIQGRNLIITPNNHNSQGLLDTHFSSTNDRGSVRLIVVPTGSTTGLMTSNQLEKERERNQKVISIKLFNSTGY